MKIPRYATINVLLLLVAAALGHEEYVNRKTVTHVLTVTANPRVAPEASRVVSNASTFKTMTNTIPTSATGRRLKLKITRILPIKPKSVIATLPVSPTAISASSNITPAASSTEASILAAQTSDRICCSNGHIDIRAKPLDFGRLREQTGERLSLPRVLYQPGISLIPRTYLIVSHHEQKTIEALTESICNLVRREGAWGDLALQTHESGRWIFSARLDDETFVKVANLYGIGLITPQLIRDEGRLLSLDEMVA